MLHFGTSVCLDVTSYFTLEKLNFAECAWTAFWTAIYAYLLQMKLIEHTIWNTSLKITSFRLQTTYLDFSVECVFET